MYCPNCGTQPPAGQKFCRACGMDLRVVTDAFAHQQTDKPSAQSLLLIERRTLHGAYLKALAGLAAIFLGFALFSSLKIDGNAGSGQTFGVLLAMAGIFMVVRPLLALLRSGQPLTPATSQPLISPSETATLPPLKAEAPSVAEDTTRHLQPEHIPKRPA
jgi:hypothetical protein